MSYHDPSITINDVMIHDNETIKRVTREATKHQGYVQSVQVKREKKNQVKGDII